jgi:adenylate kinase
MNCQFHTNFSGYNSKKIQNNIECEIFQMALDEARSSYKKDIVFDVRGETEEDMEKNLEHVEKFLDSWKED